MNNNSHKLVEAFIPKLPNQLAEDSRKEEAPIRLKGRPRKYAEGETRPKLFSLALSAEEKAKLGRIATARFKGNESQALRAALEAFPE